MRGLGGGLVLVEHQRGRVSRAALLGALASFVVVAGGYLGLEEWTTGGAMSRSVFLLPAGPLRSINLAPWGHVAGVLASIGWKSVGLVALCGPARRTGLGRRAAAEPLDRLLGVYLAAELAGAAAALPHNLGVGRQLRGPGGRLRGDPGQPGAGPGLRRGPTDGPLAVGRPGRGRPGNRP